MNITQICLRPGCANERLGQNMPDGPTLQYFCSACVLHILARIVDDAWAAQRVRQGDAQALFFPEDMIRKSRRRSECVKAMRRKYYKAPAWLDDAKAMLRQQEDAARSSGEVEEEN
jgi:ABC-type protease/lipase transport system fused ATPase/permease subunit